MTVAVTIGSPKIDTTSLFIYTANQLRYILGEDVEIHHIGSTAVSGMDGKNIIDVLLLADGPEKVNELKNKLITAGYFVSRKPALRDNYIFLASRETETGEGDIHIHIAVNGSKLHNDFLLLRDYLRSHDDEAAMYSRIKHQYANRAGYDRSVYKQLKSAYVDKLLERARKWQKNDRV